MRTTVTIDDDIFQAARSQAEASGKKLGEVLSLLARRGLNATSEGAERKGLPTFQVKSGTAIIPSNRARTLLADDAS